MNIIKSLTFRHLHLNRGRTLITIIGIVLSVAMVCCVAGFVLSLRDLGINMIKENKGDWHIAYVDVSQETAGQIAAEDIFSSSYTEEGDTEGSVNIHLRTEHPKRDIMKVAGAIAEKYGVERWGGNTELLALEGVIPYDNMMVTIIFIAAIAIFVIVVGSIIVIANSFNISASERVRQYGLLKSVGATGSQLKRSILFEAFILTIIAIPVGIVLGFIIQAVVLWLTNGLFTEIFSLNNFSMTFRVVFDPLVIYISIAIALITAFISAWLPARRASKISAIDAIRQTKDIQIRSKKLRTSRLTQLIFGFEGTLAAKSLKRNSGKYRATVVSLTMSIILFVSMSSFIWVINKGVELEYGGFDFDVLTVVKGGVEMSDKTGDLLRSIPDARVNMMRRTIFDTRAPDGFVMLDPPWSMTDENGYGLILYPIPDAEFSTYQLQPDIYDIIPGVLINTVIITQNNRRIELAPFDCEVGQTLPLMLKGEDGEAAGFGIVAVKKIVNIIPDIIPGALFDGRLISIMIPESIYTRLLTKNEAALISETETYYVVSTANPDSFTERAVELFDHYPIAEDESRIIRNISQMTRLNHNITVVVMLFGYGFIAMLSLIAVTSVVATISTGMALRRQEFAMLFSVGMTSKGMNKMLNLESLLYGLKSLLIGLPISVVLSLLIHKAMTNSIVFAYSPPITAMIVSAAAVMVLTFGTIRYGKRKLSKISIVEAIRNEIV